MLTQPQKELIASNVSLRKLSDRMLLREGKSSETLRRYLEGVCTFTEYMQCSTPDQALEQLQKEKDITEKLDSYVDWLLSVKGFNPINLKAHFAGVKKWAISNRLNGIDWQYITKPKVVSQIRDRIPTREELRLILNNKISLRDRAFFMCGVSGGLRIGTLATLQARDYQPIEKVLQDPPARLGMITVHGAPHRKLSNGRSYFTLITPETRMILEGYLSTREQLQPESPLFAKERGESEKFLSPYVCNVARQWRRLLRRANLTEKVEDHAYFMLHGHVLRKFFQTNCKLAGCRADFVDSWMGHHPTHQNEYLNDSYFRPEIRAHVEEYRKAIPNLTIFESTESESLKEEIQELRKEVEELKTGSATLKWLDSIIDELDARARARRKEELQKMKKKPGKEKGE